MRLPKRFALLTAFLCAVTSLLAADLNFYVGTSTRKDGSKGIYNYRLNAETGAVTGGALVAEAQNPTFLAVHPNGKFLYAANEVERSGGVSAYAIEPDGKLKLLSSQPSRGAGATHLTVDPAGKHVLVANYGSGSSAALPIKPDGSVGEATGFVQHTGSSVHPQRQSAPHAHAIYTDPSGKRVYSCDLGLDKVLIYQLDAEKGTLTPNDPPFATVAPGSGPRHLAFHPKGGFAYVINEMLNTVTAFKHDAANGKLEEIQTVPTLPEGFSDKNSTAEIFVHPNGRFVYGSNRGHDSIVVFAAAADGKLTLVQHMPTGGKAPRNFGLDPGGKWLLAANQQSNDIFVFKVDPATGKLTATAGKVTLAAPMCVMFVP